MRSVDRFVEKSGSWIGLVNMPTVARSKRSTSIRELTQPTSMPAPLPAVRVRALPKPAAPAVAPTPAPAVVTRTAASEWWASPDGRARLLQGDSLELLEQLPEHSVDVIFADPPYFLSNGGTTCQNGKRVSVDKGGWDRSLGAEDNHEFNTRWLAACQRLLTPNGTIWVSGTAHVIFSVGYAMQQLGFKLLNDIVWEKPNPPPNLSCRYFTHSSELVLWAARGRKSRHHYDYPAMKQQNGGKQMKNVWRLPAPGKGEKLHGKHPTQKPLALLERILRASCPTGGRVLDPFNGSGTTGVAAIRLGCSYVGLERESEYLQLTQRRLLAEVPEWASGEVRADVVEDNRLAAVG